MPVYWDNNDVIVIKSPSPALGHGEGPWLFFPRRGGQLRGQFHAVPPGIDQIYTVKM